MATYTGGYTGTSGSTQVGSYTSPSTSSSNSSNIRNAARSPTPTTQYEYPIGPAQASPAPEYSAPIGPAPATQAPQASMTVKVSSSPKASMLPTTRLGPSSQVVAPYTSVKSGPSFQITDVKAGSQAYNIGQSPAQAEYIATSGRKGLPFALQKEGGEGDIGYKGKRYSTVEVNGKTYVTGTGRELTEKEKAQLKKELVGSTPEFQKKLGVADVIKGGNPFGGNNSRFGEELLTEQGKPSGVYAKLLPESSDITASNNGLVGGFTPASSYGYTASDARIVQFNERFINKQALTKDYDKSRSFGSNLGRLYLGVSNSSLGSQEVLQNQEVSTKEYALRTGKSYFKFLASPVVGAVESVEQGTKPIGFLTDLGGSVSKKYILKKEGAFTELKLNIEQGKYAPKITDNMVNFGVTVAAAPLAGFKVVQAGYLGLTGYEAVKTVKNPTSENVGDTLAMATPLVAKPIIKAGKAGIDFVREGAQGLNLRVNPRYSEPIISAVRTSKESGALRFLSDSAYVAKQDLKAIASPYVRAYQSSSRFIRETAGVVRSDLRAAASPYVKGYKATKGFLSETASVVASDVKAIGAPYSRAYQSSKSFLAETGGVIAKDIQAIGAPYKRVGSSLSMFLSASRARLSSGVQASSETGVIKFLRDTKGVVAGDLKAIGQPYARAYQSTKGFIGETAGVVRQDLQAIGTPYARAFKSLKGFTAETGSVVSRDLKAAAAPYQRAGKSIGLALSAGRTRVSSLLQSAKETSTIKFLRETKDVVGSDLQAIGAPYAKAYRGTAKFAKDYSPIIIEKNAQFKLPPKPTPKPREEPEITLEAKPVPNFRELQTLDKLTRFGRLVKGGSGDVGVVNQFGEYKLIASADQVAGIKARYELAQYGKKFFTPEQLAGYDKQFGVPKPETPKPKIDLIPKTRDFKIEIFDKNKGQGIKIELKDGKVDRTITSESKQKTGQILLQEQKMAPLELKQKPIEVKPKPVQVQKQEQKLVLLQKQETKQRTEQVQKQRTVSEIFGRQKSKLSTALATPSIQGSVYKSRQQFKTEQIPQQKAVEAQALKEAQAQKQRLKAVPKLKVSTKQRIAQRYSPRQILKTQTITDTSIRPPKVSFKKEFSQPKRRKESFGKVREVSRYNPSLEAVLFNVKGSRPSETAVKSGLVTRPFVEKKRRKRK